MMLNRPHYSYYDKHYRMSPALIRARQPFLIKNIFTGLGLLSITVGIYIWTIKAIGQDDFSDLDMPDPPPRKRSVTATVSYPDTGSSGDGGGGGGGVGKNIAG